MNKRDGKLIKEKYTQLLLSHQMGGITTIGATRKLSFMQKCFKQDINNIKINFK